LERACLKKECFNNLLAEGRFEGSFTKQLAIICLNDWRERKKMRIKNKEETSER